MAEKFNFKESPVKKVAAEIRDEVTTEKPVEVGRSEHTEGDDNETLSPVVQTTVVQSNITLGVNVQLPEDYHLRLTMHNKRNHLGGIKNIATQVVMEWIDKNCK